jgi:hypothetical protein
MEGKTQLERLRALLDEFGIGYTVELEQCKRFVSAGVLGGNLVDDGRMITVKTDAGGGYAGLFAVFGFDEDGTFDRFGVWD